MHTVRRVAGGPERQCGDMSRSKPGVFDPGLFSQPSLSMALEPSVAAAPPTWPTSGLMTSLEYTTTSQEMRFQSGNLILLG